MLNEAEVTSAWLSVEEARAELGITSNKIAQFLADGTLPHVKSLRDRRKKYVKPEDVQRLKQELAQFPVPVNPNRRAS